jgi:PPE-repeat protein
MLDFGLLPPEITSARMYSGPGSEPTMVAASAWDTLAAELDSFTRGYSSVIAVLQDESWAGPASQAMAAAAAPYAQWAATTAVRAEHAAGQARAAAAAFETAHAAVAPPAAVAANRTLLADLIATNILGHNTARIAATEAAYDAMWVQDALAMHGYATSASSATKLAPFTGPPPTTNPAAASAAPAAAAASQVHALSQFLSTVPQLLSGAPSSGTLAPSGIPIPNSLLTGLSNFGTLYGPFETYFMTMIRNVGTVGDFLPLAVMRIFTDGALFSSPGGPPGITLYGATSPTAAGAASPTGVLATAAESTAGAGVNRAVLASVGEATAVGQLSAPAAWAHATPVAAVNEQWLPSGTKGPWGAAPAANAAGAGPAAGVAPMAGAAGVAAAGRLKRPSISAILQVAPPRFKMPRSSSGG